jgi:hypothetical protein
LDLNEKYIEAVIYAECSKKNEYFCSVTMNPINKDIYLMYTDGSSGNIYNLLSFDPSGKKLRFYYTDLNDVHIIYPFPQISIVPLNDSKGKKMEKIFVMKKKIDRLIFGGKHKIGEYDVMNGSFCKSRLAVDFEILDPQTGNRIPQEIFKIFHTSNGNLNLIYRPTSILLQCKSISINL